MMTGKTQNLAVIGCPVEHSLSPAMQNTAIAAAGVDFAYIALKVLPECLALAVAGLRATNFRGFNVTIPHKQTIMPLLDEVTDEARKIGAVNTVVNNDGKLIGYNTDAEGFVAGLIAADCLPQGKKAVILGAGGAARAVMYGLLKNGANLVVVGARNSNKAEALASDFADMGDTFGVAFADKRFAFATSEADLFINATPLGMTGQTKMMPPIDWETVKPSATFYDLIYTPAETKFLREAKQRGHKAINGELMLAAQGAAAFKLWTGQDADTDKMKKTLRECLNS